MVLRFPFIDDRSPLRDVCKLLRFFVPRKEMTFLFGQMDLKHVFNRFAGEVAI